MASLPLGPRIDEVYARTYERVLERNRRYYDRYPADRERVLALHDRIEDDDSGCRAATV